MSGIWMLRDKYYPRRPFFRLLGLALLFFFGSFELTGEADTSLSDEFALSAGSPTAISIAFENRPFNLEVTGTERAGVSSSASSSLSSKSSVSTRSSGRSSLCRETACSSSGGERAGRFVRGLSGRGVRTGSCEPLAEGGLASCDWCEGSAESALCSGPDEGAGATSLCCARPSTEPSGCDTTLAVLVCLF